MDEHGLTVPAEAAEFDGCLRRTPRRSSRQLEFATAAADAHGRTAGEAALLVGAEQPKEVHALALVLNQSLLGNVGRGGSTLIATSRRRERAVRRTWMECTRRVHRPS
jgi:hypothetical protein